MNEQLVLTAQPRHRHSDPSVSADAAARIANLCATCGESVDEWAHVVGVGSFHEACCPECC